MKKLLKKVPKPNVGINKSARIGTKYDMTFKYECLSYFLMVRGHVTAPWDPAQQQQDPRRVQALYILVHSHRIK
jgi:hypothetical protein